MAPRKKDEAEQMGQPAGTEKGTPDPRAQAEVEAAQAKAAEIEAKKAKAAEIEAKKAKAAEIEAKKAKAAEQADAPPGAPSAPEGDLRTQLTALLADPDIARTALIAAGIVPPERAKTAHYDRDYEREPQLRVTGGLEVAHAPGFRPRPPGAVPLFITADAFVDDVGATTNDEALAQKDGNGDAIPTPQYANFLRAKMEGARLSRAEIIDIEVSQGGHIVAAGEAVKAGRAEAMEGGF